MAFQPLSPSIYEEHCCQPTSPSIYEEHCCQPTSPSICEGDCCQSASPDQINYSAGDQQHIMYSIGHHVKMNKSSSMGEFRELEAKTVGHGRPRSVSQPVMSKNHPEPAPHAVDKRSFHYGGQFPEQVRAKGCAFSVSTSPQYIYMCGKIV